MRIETHMLAGATSPIRHAAVPGIWEAGHYYKAKGPTEWSVAGWSILAQFSQPHEGRLLFIDDVHTLDDVHEHERGLSTIPFEPAPEPTHIITESAVRESAFEALNVLKQLPKRKRARISGGRWRCSGFPLTSVDGTPLCLFYDLGLTWYKRQLGFTRAINVVPQFYEEEQRRLLRLVRKAMPDFDLTVIVHCKQGSWRILEG